MRWRAAVAWQWANAGICIDARCQTSDENVFAIGECALWEGKIFGLVAPGYQMARVAAALAGEEKPLLARI
jgi:nitrite reductase (NADH) large subunit